MQNILDIVDNIIKKLDNSFKIKAPRQTCNILKRVRCLFRVRLRFNPHLIEGAFVEAATLLLLDTLGAAADETFLTEAALFGVLHTVGVGILHAQACFLTVDFVSRVLFIFTALQG